MVHDLRENKARALVLDKSIIEFLAGEGGVCRLPVCAAASFHPPKASSHSHPSNLSCALCALQPKHPTGTTEDCDLFVVGETFETFSLALAFPSTFPDAEVSVLNEAIVRLQTQQGALDMLENT
jgi:hypothetical protein